MMRNKDFAVFILSHGRADQMHTYRTLKRLNYTGKIYIIIDNEDKTSKDYIDIFGIDNVFIFDKKEYAKSIDTMDNFNNRKAIVYARNYNFILAKQLGLKYFLQLDDDYGCFGYKIDKNFNYSFKVCHKLDEVFDLYLDFMINTQSDAIAMAQDGDFIGGENGGTFKKGLLRKCMNTWFFKTDNAIQFTGTLNEDYTASVYNTFLGKKIFTPIFISIKQPTTQKAKGGMSDIYLDNGTYVKTFYSVMKTPSCVKVYTMGTIHKRIHHITNWNNAAPKILNEKYKF